MPDRHTPRFVTSHPITIAVEDAESPGLPVSYGVIANISKGGACIWSDTRLAVDKPFRFRISFAQPAEVHEVTGVVVWAHETRDAPREQRCQYGVQWQGASRECRERLRDLASRAIPPGDEEKLPFEKAWTVADDEAT
jgi:hypothetical protein